MGTHLANLVLVVAFTAATLWAVTNSTPTTVPGRVGRALAAFALTALAALAASVAYFTCKALILGSVYAAVALSTAFLAWCEERDRRTAAASATATAAVAG